MKDNLFEILLNLFEKSLTQLQKNNKAIDPDQIAPFEEEDEELTAEDQSLFIKSSNQLSTRVFIYEEQMKMTKASYQFLMKMKLWGMIDDYAMEQIMEQLLFSDSRIVTLQETKWIIRNTLSTSLDEEQLAFLDLVLYHKEDELSVH